MPDVPNVLPSTTVTKRNDAINVHTSQVFGARKSNLLYFIREDASVTEVAPPLFLNQPHSEEAGSIQGDMTTRLSHNNPLFKNDNNLFYGILDDYI